MVIKKNDTVIVLAGADKGKKGKVLQADPKSGKITVEGVKIIAKHEKAKSAKKSGGIRKYEGPIDASNVQIVCSECGKNTRVASQTGTDGKKIRACKKCGKSLDKTAAEKKEKKETKTVKKAKEKKEENNG